MPRLTVDENEGRMPVHPQGSVPTPTANSVSLRLDRISKSFGSVTALRETTLDVPSGKMVALLGPSGCGKTTTLRVIAGFEMPGTGAVIINDRDVTDLPPNRRNLGMVFQNYSLFPHMTVGENIAFGLKMAGVSKTEATVRVHQMLEMVRLPGFENRYSHELSGGQQQRIALARALVTNPKVLLLDEPLGALDKNLRESMQFELRQLQQKLGITTILVTHDQEEALTVSDLIVVMNQGQVLQVGTPLDVYERPRNRFVSEFLGTSNIFPGTVLESSSDGRCRVRLSLDGTPVDIPIETGNGRARSGDSALVAIRPEKMALVLSAHGNANPVLRGTVMGQVFRGNHHAYQIRIDGRVDPIFVYRQSTVMDEGSEFPADMPVYVTWKPSNAVLIGEDK